MTQKFVTMLLLKDMVTRTALDAQNAVQAFKTVKAFKTVTRPMNDGALVAVRCPWQGTDNDPLGAQLNRTLASLSAHGSREPRVTPQVQRCLDELARTLDPGTYVINQASGVAALKDKNQSVPPYDHEALTLQDKVAVRIITDPQHPAVRAAPPDEVVRGLFATEDIQKGQFLTAYSAGADVRMAHEGRLLPAVFAAFTNFTHSTKLVCPRSCLQPEVLQEMDQANSGRRRYVWIEVNGNPLISRAMYANAIHRSKSKPNCSIEYRLIVGQGQCKLVVGLFSKHRIAAGEELLMDYGGSFFEVMEAKNEAILKVKAQINSLFDRRSSSSSNSSSSRRRTNAAKEQQQQQQQNAAANTLMQVRSSSHNADMADKAYKSDNPRKRKRGATSGDNSARQQSTGTSGARLAEKDPEAERAKASEASTSKSKSKSKSQSQTKSNTNSTSSQRDSQRIERAAHIAASLYMDPITCSQVLTPGTPQWQDMVSTLRAAAALAETNRIAKWNKGAERGNSVQSVYSEKIGRYVKLLMCRFEVSLTLQPHFISLLETAMKHEEIVEGYMDDLKAVVSALERGQMDEAKKLFFVGKTWGFWGGRHDLIAHAVGQGFSPSFPPLQLNEIMDLRRVEDRRIAVLNHFLWIEREATVLEKRIPFMKRHLRVLHYALKLYADWVLLAYDCRDTVVEIGADKIRQFPEYVNRTAWWRQPGVEYNLRCTGVGLLDMCGVLPLLRHKRIEVLRVLMKNE